VLRSTCQCSGLVMRFSGNMTGLIAKTAPRCAAAGAQLAALQSFRTLAGRVLEGCRRETREDESGRPRRPRSINCREGPAGLRRPGALPLAQASPLLPQRTALTNRRGSAGDLPISKTSTPILFSIRTLMERHLRCAGRYGEVEQNSRGGGGTAPDPLNAERLRLIACCIRPLTCLIVVARRPESIDHPLLRRREPPKQKAPARPAVRPGSDLIMVSFFRRSTPFRGDHINTARLGAIRADALPASLWQGKTSGQARPRHGLLLRASRSWRCPPLRPERPRSPTLLLGSLPLIPRPSGRRGAGCSSNPGSTGRSDWPHQSF